jgi:hypothetical protein
MTQNTLIRGASMKLLLPFILSAYPFAAAAQSQLPPLSKEKLLDHKYIPVGPLTPLTALIAR